MKAGVLPLTTRQALEIPLPKDWQPFQRNCVILFGALLGDEHPQEYGRNGQNQNGIDLLLRRNGAPDDFVGVQCRLIQRPLKKEKIEQDARATLRLPVRLKELIFATTAPDDTQATNAALEVEQALRGEGYELRIVVYSWGQLQNLIARYDAAYAAFHPAAFATQAPQSTAEAIDQVAFADSVARRVLELQGGAFAITPADPKPRDVAEDPALHAKIDTYRDLLRKENEPALAEKLLLALLADDLTGKPWAHYRILVNLGVAAMDLGREGEAATRFEEAYAVLPGDSDAKANLALARTIQGKFAEAMTLAAEALQAEPRADAAISYMLQAAGRSDWDGDPETLIPAELIGSAHAALGLSEFYRRRAMSGWQEAVLRLTEPHKEGDEFRHQRAIAILSLAVESEDAIAGGIGPVSADQLRTASRDMTALAEQHLRQGFADREDLVAHVNNAAMLMRLCEDFAGVKDLIQRALPQTGSEPQLRRLMAIAQLNLGEHEEAAETLRDDADPENRLFRAQLQAEGGDLAASLSDAQAVADEGLSARLALLKWRIIGEVALKTGDLALVAQAANSLREREADGIAASLLEIRAERQRAGVAGQDAFEAALRQLAQQAPPDLATLPRYFLAEALCNEEMGEEASRLLDGHVDLTRPNPAANLLLRALADARRDAEFKRVIANAAPELREDPATQWVVASHSWNLGDLPGALASVKKMLSAEPDHPRARLLLVEIHIRRGDSAAVQAELSKPIEDLGWKGRPEIYRLASLLVHFGFAERAAALAYRLFLEHRDESRAWLTLSMLVLNEGRGDGPNGRRWLVARAGENAAVDLVYDDGTQAFFVIEPDPRLRRLDAEAWEPEHPLAKAVSGLKAGERFVGPDGREGFVEKVRHKYVARLHYVLEHHSARFPASRAFWKIEIDPHAENGLEGLISQAKARHDWVAAEEEAYRNSAMPISVLAQRVGADVIDTALGLASHGALIRVALGHPQERDQASRAITRNGRQGCVFDALTFWTAWRLDALDLITAIAGQIHVPQSVPDVLRLKIADLKPAAAEGVKLAGYDNGRLTISENSPEAVSAHVADLERALAWLEDSAVISPIVAGDDLPVELREALRAGVSDVYDSIILAVQQKILLISDDLVTRQMASALGGDGGTWLHHLFAFAHERKQIDLEAYVRKAAGLLAMGQNYLSLTGAALLKAAELDGGAHAPGPLFQQVSKVIGGKEADVPSHIMASLECLQGLWGHSRHMPYREPVTSHLLRRLIHDRADYKAVLRALASWLGPTPDLAHFTLRWVRGHFLAA